MSIRTSLIVLLSLAAATALAGEFERDHAFEADELILTNMIGEIRVESAGGDRYEVHVAVRGDDADPDLIDVVLDEGREARLDVRFPVEEHRRYVYPELGRGSSTTIWQHDQGSGDDGWWTQLKRALGGEKITIRGSGRGLEVWADITVKIPDGRRTKIYLGAGELNARGIDGKLVLDTHSGPVTVDGHAGRLVCDTGSGEVRIRDIDGPMLADTGSGSVHVENQRGGALKVDTGSGSVTIDRADTDDLYVDTGSGSVTARRVKTDKARIDTGSGGVTLQLDRMGTGRFVIDTGSGGVKLKLPDDASATISVDTGSGGIRTDVPGAEILHKDRGELKLQVGDGEARVEIDTGSGGVTITED